LYSRGHFADSLVALLQQQLPALSCMFYSTGHAANSLILLQLCKLSSSLHVYGLR
jgi:hypothetical protein